MQLIVPIATLHRAPSLDAPQDSQVLMGEVVSVFEINEGWARVRLQRDGYVGYLQAAFLNSHVQVATHKIGVPSTLLYKSANIKTQPVQFLFMNSEISVTAQRDGFVELATGGFVFADHALPLTHFQTDFVSVAELYLNSPYLWGGKSTHGIDCSGLVQSALHASGIKSPRDTNMQEKELGTKITQENLKRGDLIFWQGHVGIMQDATTLLHASGHQMLVVSEPLAIVIDRAKASGKEITTMKRLS